MATSAAGETFDIKSTSQGRIRVVSNGLAGEVIFAPYNQIFQQLLDPESESGRNLAGANVLLVRPEDWLKYLDHDGRRSVEHHLAQTTGVSMIGGALIVLVIALILALGGFDSGYTWMVVILYFTFIHSSLILLGVLGLVKAMSGQHFRYPLIGRPFRS